MQGKVEETFGSCMASKCGVAERGLKGGAFPTCGACEGGKVSWMEGGSKGVWKRGVQPGARFGGERRAFRNDGKVHRGGGFNKLKECLQPNPQ